WRANSKRLIPPANRASSSFFVFLRRNYQQRESAWRGCTTTKIAAWKCKKKQYGRWTMTMRELPNQMMPAPAITS
ncbi:hypothetical protein M513_06750, partial [Trichuris suis]